MDCATTIGEPGLLDVRDCADELRERPEALRCRGDFDGGGGGNSFSLSGLTVIRRFGFGFPFRLNAGPCSSES